MGLRGGGASTDEPAPDLAERAAERWRGWVERHPAFTRRAHAAWVVWAWVSLIAFVVTAVAVPDTRRGMAVYLWMLYALVQVWLLARPKTITWRGFGWTFTAGVVLAPLIGIVDNLVSNAFGWQTSDAEALVWVAGPVEEALKLTPLLLVALLARNRFRRLSVCDFILLGAAAGAAFQFFEDAIRRVTAGGPSLFERLFGSVGDTQHRLWALWPGWSDSPAGARFPFHYVTTALVAGGIGLALHLRRRFGRRVVVVPVALFVLVMVDHSLYNASVSLSDVVPGWMDDAWSVGVPGTRLGRCCWWFSSSPLSSTTGPCGSSATTCRRCPDDNRA
ncbi:MAG: PrsW family glutamic-type intramembrane protease [Acidimicrobiales bacterium]